MFDWTNTYLELENSDVDTAVLMIGAIEQHGPHMPISVDWFVGDAVARGVAERLDAFLMPGIPIGNSHPHHGFRGSVSFSFKTLDAVVKDIAYSLLDQGFRRIAVINHNGGNIMVKPTCREINLSQDKGKVVHLLPSQVAAEGLSTIIESLHEEVHAGEFETSLMMHLAPEQVGPAAHRPCAERRVGRAGLQAPEGHLPGRGMGSFQPRHRGKGQAWSGDGDRGHSNGVRGDLRTAGGAGQVGTNPFTYATLTRHYSTLTRRLFDTYATLIRHLCDT